MGYSENFLVQTGLFDNLAESLRSLSSSGISMIFFFFFVIYSTGQPLFANISNIICELIFAGKRYVKSLQVNMAA